VILQCQPTLRPILANSFGPENVVVQGEALPHFDVYAPLLSVPGILETSVASVPGEVPYLNPDGALVESWRAKLAGAPGLKVGIAWQGNPAVSFDRWRSIPLAHFAPLAKVEGVTLISLQKGPGTEQLKQAACKFPVLDFGDILDESSGAFMDTAAIMTQLDLVISSDTAVPHLAGALNVPVWVALPLVPDWRWLLQRQDSPWYPTMRLFRQSELNNWEKVFKRLAAELNELVVFQR
jgi:hypothetical protein